MPGMYSWSPIWYDIWAEATFKAALFASCAASFKTEDIGKRRMRTEEEIKALSDNQPNHKITQPKCPKLNYTLQRVN
jgi:hypothetical protein